MQVVYPVLFTKMEDYILVEFLNLEILTEEKNEERYWYGKGCNGIDVCHIRRPWKRNSRTSNTLNITKGTFTYDGETVIISLVDIDSGSIEGKLIQRMSEKCYIS